MLHYWLPWYLSRTSPATGTNHTCLTHPSTWISYRISSAHVWPHPILVYVNSTEGHADNRDRPPEFQQHDLSSAALFNRQHLVQLCSQLTACVSMTGKPIISSMFPASRVHSSHIPLHMLSIEVSPNTPSKAHRAK